MADTNERTTSDDFAEKVNAAFTAFSETKEPEKTAENAADDELDDLGEPEELTDQQRLVQLTLEIAEKEKAFTELVNAPERQYTEIATMTKELAEMQQEQTQLREKVKNEPLTTDHVENLSNITPKRKSVQNLLEHEVAQTVQFESLLDKEMGGKFPYAMRKNSGNDWRNDESKTVKVITVHPRSTDPKKNYV